MKPKNAKESLIIETNSRVKIMCSKTYCVQ